MFFCNTFYSFSFLETHICPHGNFTCNNGQCTVPTFVCDGNSDCKDDSDEDRELCGTSIHVHYESLKLNK